MKHIKLFEQFVNENTNHSIFYIYNKKTSGGTSVGFTKNNLVDDFGEKLSKKEVSNIMLMLFRMPGVQWQNVKGSNIKPKNTRFFKLATKMYPDVYDYTKDLWKNMDKKLEPGYDRKHHIKMQSKLYPDIFKK